MSKPKADLLATATETLIRAALDERAAEEACRNRPWEDRKAWLTYVDALTARRQAVDALIRESRR